MTHRWPDRLTPFRRAQVMLLAICCAGLLIFGPGVGCQQEQVVQSQAVRQSSINVALFPWVPNPAGFQSAITQAWAAAHPDVAITWITPTTDPQWDGGYTGYVPANADVFVYDVTVMSDLTAAGHILPLDAAQIPNSTDLYPFALSGVQYPSGQYAGIPQLLCTNLLYYWVNDPLQNAHNLTDIWSIIGSNLDAPCPLPNGQGLYVSLSGGTTDAVVYLQVQTQLNGPYTPTPYLPQSESAFSENALAWLEVQTVMGGVAQVTSKTVNRYQEFAQGSGRAAVGYAENSSIFPVPKVSSIGFHPMPFVDSPTYTFFYIDAAAVNAQIDPSRQPLALEMAQLITSADVLEQASRPATPGTNPQYLLLSRPSAMGGMSVYFPRYAEYHAMIEGANPVVFHGGPGFVDWAEQFKDFIRTTITTPPTLTLPEVQLREAG